MNSDFTRSLTLMGQGMLGIFAVILIIFGILFFLGRSKKKK